MSDDLKDFAESAAKGAAEGMMKGGPPIYDDLLKPTVQNLGGALAVVSGIVKESLIETASLVWGYDKVASWLQPSIAEKLKDVDPKNIQEPDPKVAGPAIEAMKFAGSDKDLRELFASLIASAMNKETSRLAHPAFVQIIQNLSGSDAILFKKLASTASLPFLDVQMRVNLNNLHSQGGFGYANPIPYFFGKDLYGAMGDNTTAQIENFLRLKLFDVNNSGIYDQTAYIRLRKEFNDGEIFPINGAALEFQNKNLVITSFGRNFYEAIKK